MAGHSKWANIKRRKAQVDDQKGRVFSRISRELSVAARQGGCNPEANPRLREAMRKAREANLPAENVQRAILKGAGELEGMEFEEILYEGYGPGGVAILVEIVTDNRRRTAAAIRHLFAKYGGSLGEAGCVAWMFEKKGVVLVAPEADEDEVLATALEAGAEDVSREAGAAYEITSDPQGHEAVRSALEAAGLPVAEAELTMVPRSTIRVEEPDASRALELLLALDDHEDVQRVHANLGTDDRRAGTG